jgi:hypothetical protein
MRRLWEEEESLSHQVLVFFSVQIRAGKRIQVCFFSAEESSCLQSDLIMASSSFSLDLVGSREIDPTSNIFKLGHWAVAFMLWREARTSAGHVAR